jgi:hypothetical protein
MNLKRFAALTILFSLPLIFTACGKKAETVKLQGAGASFRPMPLHPQARAFIDQMAPPGAPGLDQLDLPVAEIRNLVLTMFTATQTGDPVAVGSVTERTVPGPAGPIPVRVYTPSGSGPFPVLVFFHVTLFLAPVTAIASAPHLGREVGRKMTAGFSDDERARALTRQRRKDAGRLPTRVTTTDGHGRRGLPWSAALPGDSRALGGGDPTTHNRHGF